MEEVPEEGRPVCRLTKWRPIATAPKNGDPFLGACPFDEGEWEILRMRWTDHLGLFVDATYAPFSDDQTQPTHWMPLPSPPEG